MVRQMLTKPGLPVDDRGRTAGKRWPAGERLQAGRTCRGQAKEIRGWQWVTVGDRWLTGLLAPPHPPHTHGCHHMVNHRDPTYCSRRQRVQAAGRAEPQVLFPWEVRTKTLRRTGGAQRPHHRYRTGHLNGCTFAMLQSAILSFRGTRLYTSSQVHKRAKLG